MQTLKKTFIKLLSGYTKNQGLINKHWNEVEKCYSNKKRYYHTLNHLDSLLSQLTEVKSEIQNWDVIIFTLYYHDIIYNSLKSNNEEKSAEIAEKRMKEASVSTGIIDSCKKTIIATKSHIYSKDNDTNFFTDADLSILGQDWEIYSSYYKNIRKEFSVYPDLLYNPGRKKVINHFLKMDRIYKTAYFYEKFEVQAKNNLQKELEILIDKND